MKKHFKIGQNIMWICNEFDGRTVTYATITEIYKDHVIAKTDDNMTLWIDEYNEMQHYDLDMIRKIDNTVLNNNLPKR